MNQVCQGKSVKMWQKMKKKKVEDDYERAYKGVACMSLVWLAAISWVVETIGD